MLLQKDGDYTPDGGPSTVHLIRPHVLWKLFSFMFTDHAYQPFTLSCGVLALCLGVHAQMKYSVLVCACVYF